MVNLESRFGDITAYMAFDYSQMEIRILAELAGCKGLIRAMESGKDVHAAVGHDMTGKLPEYFASGKPRVMMKSMHFSIVFGKDDEGLYEALIAEGIETTQEEVTKFYNDYFEKYWEVKDYIKAQQEFADQHGYVLTLFGFEREIAKHDENRGSYWGNQAVNTPVQGTAHQLILIALAEKKRLSKTFWALKDLRMEIHDALYWHILLKNIKEGYEQGKYLLETHVKKAVFRRFGITIKVPFVSECKVGFRLGSMVEYEGESMKKFLHGWLEKNAKIEDEVNDFLVGLKK